MKHKWFTTFRCRRWYCTLFIPARPRPTRWAASLEVPGERATFFNFLASHDGIGLNPARDILPEAAIDRLVQRVQERGGLVSFKSSPDGEIPYELNVNYFDALCDPGSDELEETRVDRFTAAHAILLSMRGVPGLYFHSLFGSRSAGRQAWPNWRAWSINREKLQRQQMEQELGDPTSLRARIFERLCACSGPELPRRRSDPTLINR